ncbi:hypothetical protein [Mameliella sediminis]|uniref:hypothetical protein n=1 Tax=Mameliella sediminis TaxID=2836866 RepID=UPI001C481F4F|nr:hypothetical protein [Mameliella sediminis]MBV7392713.1 hypothetical protein [Mameliella sediminis]MBY6163441.1 hypothetical protein [Mameliella alba]MBY6171704.1 hypothetical protein [Mameliella alba]MBY6176929.1 hypothetical protein [Mameliella alba]
MSSLLRVLGEGRLVYKRFIGSLALDDATGAILALETLGGYRPGMPEFTDLSQVTRFDMTRDDTRQVAQLVNRTGIAPYGRRKIGLYAPTDSQFAAACTFAELVDKEPGPTQAAVFREADAVLCWMDRPQELLDELGLRQYRAAS